MNDMEHSDEAQPEFDYSDFSRADQKELIQKQMDAQWLGTQLDENLAHLTRKEHDAMRAEYTALLDEVERRLLAHVVSVPRSWFVRSAPADISVNTPDWWLYVQADRLGQLKQAAQEARRPAAVSGN